MFNQKIVFIVGAGGSYEVGLPMGSALKDRIADKLSFEFDSLRFTGGDKRIVSTVLTLTRDQGQLRLDQWEKAAKAIRSAMPQAISIDNFLHTHSDRPDIVQLGKLAIAASILDAERDSSIYVDTRKEQMIDFRNVSPSWHLTFGKMLLENAQKGNLDNLFDNVSFITFNYDRCIEHYLVHYIQNYLMIPVHQAERLVSRLEIIHPYGQVGKLPWQNEEFSVPFGGTTVHGPELMLLATQIRTFTERFESEAMMERMRDLLRNAAQVVCLGFSYGSMNLKLLHFEKPTQDYWGPHVLGTSLGISAPNAGNLAYSLKHVFNSPNHKEAELVNLTCDQLLQDYWLRLAA